MFEAIRLMSILNKGSKLSELSIIIIADYRLVLRMIKITKTV